MLTAQVSKRRRTSLPVAREARKARKPAHAMSNIAVWPRGRCAPLEPPTSRAAAGAASGGCRHREPRRRCDPRCTVRPIHVGGALVSPVVGAQAVTRTRTRNRVHRVVKAPIMASLYQSCFTNCFPSPATAHARASTQRADRISNVSPLEARRQRVTVRSHRRSHRLADRGRGGSSDQPGCASAQWQQVCRVLQAAGWDLVWVAGRIRWR